MNDDFTQPSTFAKTVLSSREPEAILNAREQRRGVPKRPRFYGCFMVVPMPGEWRLFTQRLPVAEPSTDCLIRFWMKVVEPVVTEAWRRALILQRDVSKLQDELIDLNLGLPRGVAAAPSAEMPLSEIWFGGGLTEWMKVWPRQIEAALEPATNWRWVYTDEFGCDPVRVERAIRLLGLGRSWGAE